MKRFIFFLTLVVVIAVPFVGAAQAKKAPVQAAITIPALGVDVTSPDGVVSSPFLHVAANVTNADTADACVQRHLSALPIDLPVPCNLVSYVTFSVDGQQVASDDEAPYSMGAKYEGQDSQRFCLVNCGS